MAMATLERDVQVEQQRPTAASWDKWVTRLTWIVVAIGVAWRVGRYLAQFPIWGDEAHLAVNFPRDFWGMTQTLDYGQVAPILFLWVEWGAYHLLGASELALRFVPLVAGVVGVFLFWWFCREVLGGCPSLARRVGEEAPEERASTGCEVRLGEPELLGAAVAVGLLAVSYYPVRHATEVKPYSLDLMMALVLMLPAVRWVKDPGRLGWLIALCVLTPIAVASSYPAVFVAGAVSLYLLPAAWRGSWSARGWYVAFNVAMVTTFVGHVLLVGREQLELDHEAGTVAAGLHQYWQDWFPPANVLQLPLWLLKAHTGNMLAYPVGSNNFGSSLTFLLCAAGCWALWRGRRWGLLTLCLAPFGLSLVAAFAHKYPYGGTARLAQHLAPAICLLMGCGIVWVATAFSKPSPQAGEGLGEGEEVSTGAVPPPRPSPASGEGARGRLTGKVVVAVMIGFAVIGIGGLVHSLARPYKMLGDVRIREMAADIARDAEPGATVVVFNPHSMIRPNMVWYLWRTGHPVVWDGKADWDQVNQGRQVWGVHLRFAEGKQRPQAAKLIAASGAEWTGGGATSYVFPADGKDVPIQYGEVFRWERE